jgi:hypothetical protein
MDFLPSIAYPHAFGDAWLSPSPRLGRNDRVFSNATNSTISSGIPVIMKIEGLLQLLGDPIEAPDEGSAAARGHHFVTPCH